MPSGRTSVVGDISPGTVDERAVSVGSRFPGDSAMLLGMLWATDGGVAPWDARDPAGPAGQHAAFIARTSLIPKVC